MADDAAKLWETWARGDWAGGNELYQQTDLGATGDERLREFYNQVVGPAFGGGEEFGDVYENYIGAFDTEGFEQAEQAFRLAIGDPYRYGNDPFAWERVSRMHPDQAQDQLEAELFDQGKHLGGEHGTAYGLSTSKALESYTTGLGETRESLTYEELQGGRGLVSGTGGSVLRAGEAKVASEDILIEAYKAARTLETSYEEGRAGIEFDLEKNITDALDEYLDDLEGEKETWYQSVLADIVDAQEEGMYEFGAKEPAFGAGIGAGFEYIPDEEYGAAGWDRWQFEEEGGACGIGEIRQADGSCALADEDLEYDTFGLICDRDSIDACGVCDGDGSSCADDCGVPNGDNSSCTDDCGVLQGQNASMDECGICDGDNSSCLDDCGVPNGGNASKVPCAETNQYECPGECPESAADPAGEMICTPGYVYLEAAGGCVEINEGPQAYDVECDAGTDYASWTTGSSPTDTSNCPDYQYDPTEPTYEHEPGICSDDQFANAAECEAAGESWQEGFYFEEDEPEDDPQWGPCTCITYSSGTGKQSVLHKYYVCENSNNPLEGLPCGGGPTEELTAEEGPYGGK